MNSVSQETTCAGEVIETEAVEKPLSINPFILFQQATYIAAWKFNLSHFLVFGRKVKDSQGKRWQIVLYDCNEDGRVQTWRERYDGSGKELNAAVWNLLYRIENCMIEPQLVENIR